VTCYTEGFSHFVTSMTAPVASGWSVRRVGLAPTGKRRLLTAHAKSGRSPMERRTGKTTFLQGWLAAVSCPGCRTATIGTALRVDSRH
jgi:hypothetical protein